MQNSSLLVPPRVASGFEHINRYWDKSRGIWAAKLLPGEFYVTRDDEAVVTVLGSCVSACIRDPLAGVGGMNHFMLPEKGHNTGDAWESAGVDAAARYGSVAMEYLINEVLRAGGRRERLEVKITGGGQVLERMTSVGNRNIDFVRSYLERERLRLIAEDVGDIHPRKVMYLPSSGQMFVKRLASLHNDTLVQREREYRSSLASKPTDGSVELF
jgi:chemotaxis protein CheD